MYCLQNLLRVFTLPRRNNIVRFLCCLKMKFAHELCWQITKPVVLNLGSRDPLEVPNANLGGPKRKSGISTNFPHY